MALLKNEDAYRFALKRFDELSPMITEDMSKKDERYIEYDYLADLIVEYEKEHYPIEPPTLQEAIELRMYEMNLTQKEAAEMLGISQPRMSSLINGKFEPTLSLARKIAKVFDIMPEIVLGAVGKEAEVEVHGGQTTGGQCTCPLTPFEG